MKFNLSIKNFFKSFNNKRPESSEIFKIIPVTRETVKNLIKRIQALKCITYLR